MLDESLDQLFSYGHTVVMLIALSGTHCLTPPNYRMLLQFFLLDNLYFSICRSVPILIPNLCYQNRYIDGQLLFDKHLYVQINHVLIQLQLILGDHCWCKNVWTILFSNLPNLLPLAIGCINPPTASIAYNLHFLKYWIKLDLITLYSTNSCKQ